MKKTIGLLIAIQLMATQVMAMTSFSGEKNDRVLKILKRSSESATLMIEENTFVFNINGYACQWPGLKIPNGSAAPDLNHNRFYHFGSDKYNLVFGIKSPNHQYCDHFGNAEAVFGKEFILGTQLPIKINRVLDLRKGVRMDVDGKMTLTKLIYETITIQINGRTLESTAEINLGKLP